MPLLALCFILLSLSDEMYGFQVSRVIRGIWLLDRAEWLAAVGAIYLDPL